MNLGEKKLEKSDRILVRMDYIRGGREKGEHRLNKAQQFLEDFYDLYDDVMAKIQTFDRREEFLEYVNGLSDETSIKNLTSAFNFLEMYFVKIKPQGFYISYIPRLKKVLDSELRELRSIVRQLDNEVDSTVSKVKSYSMRICPEELKLIREQLKSGKKGEYL